LAAILSGTTTFSLNVDDLLEQALEPLGGEHTSAEEAKKARRVLNLLLIEMRNKNIPLNKIGTEVVTLLYNTAVYVLNTNIESVLEATICLSPPDPKNISDIKIQSKSVEEFFMIPNKLVQNRPNTYMVERLTDGPVVTIWPVPNNPTDGPYILKMKVARKIEDVTAAYQRVDLPTRYLPLLVAWLSYKLSMTRTSTDPNLRQMLQAEYMQILTDTVEADNEKTDYIVRPGGIGAR
jgi:hypothetical protein